MNTKTLAGLGGISAFLKKIGFDYFIAGILVMILLARLWPEGGLETSPLALPQIASWGVTLIFFFYGLRLSKAKLVSGLTNWKLHILVQLSTFLLFPLLILLVKPFFRGDEYLWLGTFFLASLPSTVSSSVVMVSVAGGNLPGAIFNASISGILGIFLTPVWMSIALQQENGASNLPDVITKLTVQVLIPVILGFLLNKKWGGFAERNKQRLKYYDQSIILIIVYTSFAESFSQNLFENLKFHELLFLAVAMAGLFFLVFYLISVLSRLLKFSQEDRITAIFCGSKKSLVHGTVMSKALFSDSNATGLVLLPLMLYHAMQLCFAAIIAQRWSRGSKEVSPQAQSK
ncbi:bile acid:sodium symporter family protein [Pedobacter sp. SYSU D00535]|uniref:bile acid:sodium symporter family protein n=1 Tax=Pedobacter sp. SYSU D00535 TaxID=2810308 RepID=UPI001A971B67|nr:bile acid:sodium symporter family protein [Pedobacter sp. SYSU D00535]